MQGRPARDSRVLFFWSLQYKLCCFPGSRAGGTAALASFPPARVWSAPRKGEAPGPGPGDGGCSWAAVAEAFSGEEAWKGS